MKSTSPWGGGGDRGEAARSTGPIANFIRQSTLYHRPSVLSDPFRIGSHLLSASTNRCGYSPEELTNVPRQWNVNAQQMAHGKLNDELEETAKLVKLACRYGLLYRNRQRNQSRSHRARHDRSTADHGECGRYSEHRIGQRVFRDGLQRRKPLRRRWCFVV